MLFLWVETPAETRYSHALSIVPPKKMQQKDGKSELYQYFGIDFRTCGVLYICTYIYILIHRQIPSDYVSQNPIADKVFLVYIHQNTIILYIYTHETHFPLSSI